MNNKSQFKKISTGNGYQNDLIATTNDRLELTVTALQNLEHAVTANLMFLQGDIKDLDETIKAANKKNDRLQRLFLLLSVLGTILASAQVVQVIDILRRGIGK